MVAHENARPVRHEIDEVGAALSLEISRCVSRAVEHAEMLESLGELLAQVALEVIRDAPPKDLERHAHGLRGLATQGLSALTDLHRVAGRLEALAAVRAAAEVGVWTRSAATPTRRQMAARTNSRGQITRMTRAWDPCGACAAGAAKFHASKRRRVP